VSDESSESLDNKLAQAFLFQDQRVESLTFRIKMSNEVVLLFYRRQFGSSSCDSFAQSVRGILTPTEVATAHSTNGLDKAK